MTTDCGNKVVTAIGLSKIYQRQTLEPIEAIQDITLDVYNNEIVCILGPSGCGKSTLLNLIAGLQSPTTGTVFVCGKAPSESRAEVTYIQQSPQLLRYRSILANAALGLELRGQLNPLTLSKVRELLRFLGLKDFESSYPAELSGGMRQRVALARALAIETPLILCDEPLASLDFDSRLEIEEFFWSSNKTDGRASIFVTHNIDSAVALADRVIILSPRPAKIEAIINIDDCLREVSPLNRRESPLFAQYFSDIWHPLRIATGMPS